LVALLGLLAAASRACAAAYQAWPLDPPAPFQEFRGAWVAAVANIDWPSRKDLDPAAQKAELTAVIENAARLRLNVVILQVRPACDALYASRLEPWSEYLTGTMGRAPSPVWDPLAFAIAEAHQRGLELHAWFNPFRALHNSAKSPIAPGHISRTHPAWVRSYGHFLWLDPGEPGVRDYSLSVVMDVVNRYDIDGVHFDDYFYPYKERDAAGREIDFPDGPSWERFGAGGRLDRGDWRRENINNFVRRTYAAIKAAKPWVKFGVSPFGIWRPGQPKSVDGLDAYDGLYADSRRWLSSGWVDYFAPQLYWPIDSPRQSFPALLGWWARQNTHDRLLVPGLDLNRVRGSVKPTEIANQCRLTRKQPGAAGEILWGLGALPRNQPLWSTLTREVYAQPALMPPAPWLGHGRQLKPFLSVTPAGGAGGVELAWQTAGGDAAARWLLQSRTAGVWRTEILGANVTSRHLAAAPDQVAVRPVDRFGSLGPPAGARRRD